MKEVFRNADSALVGLYESILEDAGIPSFVYNLGTLQMPAAGLAVAFFPLPIFFPTLCVLDDGDYESALRILSPLRAKDPAPVGDWDCRNCGESVPDNFTNCWKCESSHEPL
jgi:hypothetical protein